MRAPLLEDAVGIHSRDTAPIRNHIVPSAELVQGLPELGPLAQVLRAEPQTPLESTRSDGSGRGHALQLLRNRASPGCNGIHSRQHRWQLGRRGLRSQRSYAPPVRLVARAIPSQECCEILDATPYEISIILVYLAGGSDPRRALPTPFENLGGVLLLGIDLHADEVHLVHDAASAPR